MARLFFSVAIPDPVTDVVRDLQGRIPDGTGEFSYVEPEHAHITLKFLGDADPGSVVEKVEGLSMPDVELTTSRTGYFPHAGFISVYWLGFDDAPGLQQLADDLDEGLPSFERDHDFTPHVTVARVKDLWGEDEFKEATDVDVESVSFSPDSFVLMESELDKDGPSYQVVERF